MTVPEEHGQRKGRRCLRDDSGGAGSRLPALSPGAGLRAQLRGRRPRCPLPPCVRVREGNDHVSTPSPRGGSEVSQRGPQANGVRRAPPACSPAPSHCRVHACVCACAIGGMGPWARCEGGW